MASKKQQNIIIGIIVVVVIIMIIQNQTNFLGATTAVCSYPTELGCIDIGEQVEIIRQVIDGQCTGTEALTCQAEYDTTNDEWCEIYLDQGIVSFIGVDGVTFGYAESCDTNVYYELTCNGMTAIETYTDCSLTSSICQVGSGCVGAPTCTDSDGGIDKFNHGTVDDGTTQYSDSCESPSEVWEWYCDGTTPTQQLMSCGAGYTCEDPGECQAQQAVCTPGEVICVSSTEYRECDANGQWGTYLDCPAQTPYCDEVSRTCEECVFDAHCPANYVCIDNLCQQQAGSCSDTDGGIDYNVKGTATDADGSDTDYCWSINPDYLYEFYCEGDIVTYIWYECPNGCEIGRCLDACNTEADNNPCDGVVDNNELLVSISNWVDNLVTNTELLIIISAWVNS